MKLVSVIIPTKNSATYLERCLQSIRNQTYPEIEIIVVDNHSSDMTTEIATRYGTLITGGRERSAQINLGFKQANGAYIYRIDGDFELEPDVVEACVVAIEERGADMVAVPNRVLGESYWSRVRQLERDTYLDDDLIVAARFWRREAFEAVGGVDESLVSCEDYDLHNRMLDEGYTLARIKPCEIHLGEPDSLWEHTKKSFYYGPSAWRYVRKHPSKGFRQMFPVRPSYVRHRRHLFRNPKELLGLLLLKFAEYGAAGLAICLSWLGFLDQTGRLSSTSIGGLILLLGSLGALLSLLPRFGISDLSLVTIAILSGGLLLWVYVGRRYAQVSNQPWPSTLVTVSLCFSPYLFLYAFGYYLPQETWLFVFSFANAVVASLLVYLANPWSRASRWTPWAIVLVSVAFVVFFILRLVGLLRSYHLIADELVIFDQAMWATAFGEGSGGQLYTSAILGRSIFSDVAAPALLLLWPLYKLGLGGPILLLSLQIAFVGLMAIALYRLGERPIGKAPAFFIGCAFLLYFLTARLVGRGVSPEIFGMVALLFGLSFLERHKYLLYFLMIILAAASGPLVAISLVGVGLIVLFREEDRWLGMLTLFVGVISTWILIFVFGPYFGGIPFQLPVFEDITVATPLVELVSQPLARNYILLLLAPLAFAPLLGFYWLLPALPVFFYKLQDWRLTAVGSSEVVIIPFLFVAVIFGLAWIGRKLPSNRGENVRKSGAILVLVSCLFTAQFLNPGQLVGPWWETSPSGIREESELLANIPPGASLSTHSTLALSFAHRPQLYLLPKVEDADFVLVDLFSMVEESRKDEYAEVVQKMFINPEYGLRSEVNGLFLFERGLDLDQNVEKLALAETGEIEFPNEIVLEDTVIYRGFSSEDIDYEPGRPFTITTYWESLKTVQKPYLIFSSYPGQQQFEEAVFGLYPVSMWQTGQLIRQRHLITIPSLPPGDDYEFVAGLWFDTGEPALENPEQLLGEDVIRVARIKVEGDRYLFVNWDDEGGN